MGYRDVDLAFGYYPDGDYRLCKVQASNIPQLSDQPAIEGPFLANKYVV
jgi:hypothetical protein